MAQILDGKIVRDKIAEDLKSKIQNLLAPPRLVIIQVGDNPESNTYIAQKIKFGEKIGANIKHLQLPDDISEKTLNFQIANFNLEKSINGIIIQLPIPESLDKDQIIESINPAKDVDGLTSTNVKLLFEGSSHVIARNEVTKQSQKQIATGSTNPRNDKSSFQGFLPATTKGILTLLTHYKIDAKGKHVVIIGRSTLVGKPTALAFLNLDATVTVCHSKTQNMEQITKSADIIISAVGKPGLITKDHVRKGQVIVDVGTTVISSPVIAIRQPAEKQSLTSHPEPDFESSRNKLSYSGSDKTRLVGDVNFDEVSKIVDWISPVPGGVGPMTVASLFENLLQAYTNQND